jgi:iron complex transport system ATP-binding protein
MEIMSISIEGLDFSYGDKQIFNDFNLKLEKGKFYSIVGPNGSGKSTLVKLIVNVLSPSTGKILINGKDKSKLKARERAKLIAYIPQESIYDFDFTASEVVLMGRSPHKNRFEPENSYDFRITEKVMRMTETWELRDSRINNLSGGEQQRVTVARAMAQETGIILLDEPVSHMDIRHQVDMLEIFSKMTGEHTIIAVMHDLNIAAVYSDYMIMLNEGKLATMGTPSEVLTESMVKNVYGIDTYIIEDPIHKTPHLISISGSRKQET